MKSSLTLTIFLIATFNCLSQQWGTSTFGQYINEAVDVEINNNGEAYTVGYLTGETSFNTSTTVSGISGNGDIYIAKYAASGNLIWEKTFGGNYSDRAVDLAIGPDQNIVVTGQFFGTVSFGSVALTSSGNSKDIFLVKLDPQGNVIWARSEGGNMAENAYGVTVDYQNNVILTGQFQGSAMLGNNSFVSTTDPNTNLPSFDFFIAKYTSSGSPLWSLNGAAPYEDRGLAVAVDNQNNIFFTGQFSKNLNFASNTYANLAYNVGFLSKLSPSGQLIFFNQLKAGMTNPYDLEVNTDNDVIVTGDFLGSLNYYDASGIHSIQNAYDKHIFILKTANNGNYQWNYTLGSNNEISARSVSMDPHKDIFVTGYFKCDLSQIHDTATATFNSVGFKDPYLLKIDNTGQFVYIKHFGGKMDDEGHGVAIRQNDKPFICGSFTKDLNFAATANTNFATTYTSNYALNEYPGETPHFFLTGDSTRNSFLVNQVNNNYPVFNYYINSPSDSLIGYITTYDSPFTEPDTVHFCHSEILFYNTLTWSHYGPSYSYLWNTGSMYEAIGIINTGNYSVQVKRDDECAFETDSIYAISDPIPLLPNLTDNYGINLNQSPEYYDYHFCYPDSLTIHYSNLQPGTVLSTTHPGGTILSGAGPFNIQQEGVYMTIAMNQYCSDTADFFIQYDVPIPFDTLQPDIVMNTPVPTGDSITICLGDQVCFAGIDLITNPGRDFNIELPHPVFDAHWTVSGNNSGNTYKLKTCFEPQISGWYTVDLHFVVGYNNLCGIDTVHYQFSKSFYITVNPIPAWSGTISGPVLLCENSSLFLTFSNPNPDFAWSGPGIIWNNGGDSIEVNLPGTYSYSGTLTDSINGCSATFSNLTYITLKTISPVFSTPADGVICPGDSVLMQVPAIYQSYEWINPEGYSLSTTNSCYGDDLGFYYCHVVDNEGCHLTTPPYELREYTTPSISVIPDEFLCPGETVTLLVAYAGEPTFVWSPVNSTQDQITVNSPGVYSIQIMQCGFTITDSIEIIDGSFNASIQILDSTLCYQDSVVITGTPSNTNYTWNNGQVTGSVYSVLEPGTYYATVTNEFGCTAQTNTVTIVETEGSEPPAISSQTVCYGTSVVLNSTAPYTLHWYSVSDTILLQTGNQLTLTNVLSDTSFLIAFEAADCPPAFNLVSIQLADSIASFSINGDSLLCQHEDGVFSVSSNSGTLQWFSGTSLLGTSNPINIPFNILNNNPLITAQVSNQCYSIAVTDSVTIISQVHLELEADSIFLCYYDSGMAEVLNPGIDLLFWNSNLGVITDPVLHLNGSIDYGPVSVYGIDESGCLTDTAWLQIHTSDFSTSIDIEFTNYCLGDSVTIHVDTNADSVLWSTPFGNPDTTSLSFVVSPETSGIYTIEYWDQSGCHYQDSLVIPLYQFPDLSILPDSIFCLNDVYTFYFPEDSNSYQWLTYGNSIDIPILYDQSLILTATSPHGCVTYDTLVAHTVNCDNELPNIITPNGDGINDYFIIDDAYSQQGNTLIIINRWGNLMYEASPYRNDFFGKDISEGVYFYLYYPEGKNNPKLVKRGFLHLIR